MLYYSPFVDESGNYLRLAEVNYPQLSRPTRRATMKTFLGIELGSTRIKAVLIDETHAPSSNWEAEMLNTLKERKPPKATVDFVPPVWYNSQ